MTESILNGRRGPTLQAILLRAVTGLAIALAGGSALAQGALREGVNYTVVKPAQPTAAPVGKTEVIEFFGYWCPHCNDFEPVLSDWSKRNDAKASMAYVPVAFNSSMANLQKLYYTLDTLGKERELRRKVFNSIHNDHTLSFGADAGAMADWAAKNGIEKASFLGTFNSFTVQTKVTRANQIASAYGVTGVPMLGIGGKYLLNVDAKSIGAADVFLARVISEK